MHKLTVQIDLTILCVLVSCLILMMSLGLSSASPMRKREMNMVGDRLEANAVMHSRVEILRAILHRVWTDRLQTLDGDKTRLAWLLDSARRDALQEEKVEPDENKKDDNLYEIRARRRMYPSGEIRIAKNGWERSGWGGGYGR